MSKQAPQSGSKNVQFGLLLATVFSVLIRSAPVPAYAPEQQQALSGDAFCQCAPEIPAVALGSFALSLRCG